MSVKNLGFVWITFCGHFKIVVFEMDNYIKNPDLSLFCRKSPHFSFLQKWALTFQFSAKLDLDISIFYKLVPCMAFQFFDISICP